MSRRRHKPTWKWAFGNKRQKKKVAALLGSGCGCWYCCPDDRRQKIRARDDRREVTS